MNLTDSELRTVDRMRKAERAWRWWRWPFLVSTLVCAGVFAYALFDLYEKFRTNPDFTYSVANLACYSAVYLNIFMINWFMAVWTLCRWKGNPSTRLLLRLLEEHDTRRS
jgi:hypothetical protein